MNQELRALLTECDPCGEGPAGDWRAFLIVQNVGGIPPGAHPAPSAAWQRGFNLLALDSRGRPVRFCKCRDIRHEGLRRENLLLAALSKDPSLTRTIPRTGGAQRGDLRVQVSAYLPGQLYRAMIPGLTLTAWQESMCEILAVAMHVSARAATLIPQFRGASAPAEPLKRFASLLRETRSWDQEADEWQAVEWALQRAPPVPESPQHGDLWPTNVIHYQNAWWLLDFELFGKVCMPMYDVFHFIRTSIRFRDPLARKMTWLDRLTRDDHVTRACRSIIRHSADHYGLSPQQTVGTFVFYVAHVAASFRADRKKLAVWQPLMRELKCLATHLQHGTALERVLLGSL